MFDHCIDIDWGGECRLYHAEMRTARKKHQCGECHQLILPGTKYEYVSGLNEDTFYHFKTCSICCAIRNDLVGGGSFVHGELWEALRETYGLGYDEILEDPGGARGWDRWEDDHEWAAYVKKLEEQRAARERRIEQQRIERQEAYELMAADAVGKFFQHIWWE